MAKTKNMNLGKLMQHFHSDEKCRAYLEKLRWPDGPDCPRCSCDSVSSIKDRDIYDCNSYCIWKTLG